MDYKQITSWEDAAQALQIDPVASLPYPQSNNADQEAANGFYKMQLICRLSNDGWIPDWDNWNENKYYPWFKLSGGGFSSHGCGYAGTAPRVGARLVFRDKKMAIYAGQTFTDIYKSFMTL